MSRSITRILAIIALLSLAVVAAWLGSGYVELKKASASSDHAEAARAYRNAAQRIFWRTDLYELAGHHFYYAADYAAAAMAYQAALEHESLSPEGWVAWGDVLYLQDDHEQARQIWERASERANPSGELYARLAKIYQAEGDWSRAAQMLQRHLSAHPGDAAGHYRLGLLLAVSDPEQAASELADAAQLNPEFASAVGTLRDALDLAARSDSDSARQVIIGRGLGLVSEWELARAAFASAVRSDETNAEAWAWLGEANQQTDLPEGGSAELDRALALNPNLPTVRGLRGLSFQRAGNFRAALAEFQAAAALEPQNPTWFVSLGEAHAKTGDLILALQAYQTATSLAPEDPEYWRLLAIFCGQNNVNLPDVGIPAAQQAVILTPGSAAAQDVLGWLLTLNARYEEAQRVLNRAIELDPSYASAHLHLGMLYLQMDDRDLARDHLMKARDLGNTDAELVLGQYFP